MSTTLGTLTIDLRANTASFSQSMDKMSTLSARTANDIKRSLERIGTAGLALGSAIATGTAALIERSTNAITSLNRLSQASGTTVEKFSTLSYAAKRSGVETEELSKGLEKLSKAAFGAQNGNQQLANIFKRLGVSVTDSNGHLKDSSDIFNQVAVRLSGMADGAGKTALALALFGKSGAQLIPMLNEYGQHQAQVTEEAKKFGLVISTDTAEKATKFHEELKSLKLAGEGFAQQLTASVLPALLALGARFEGLGSRINIPQLTQAIGEKLTSAVNKVGDALQFATKHAQVLKVTLEALAAIQLSKIAIPVIADLANGGIEKVAAGFGKFVTSALGITKVIKPLEQFAGWIKYTTQFLGMLASEEGIASAATYALEAGFVAIGGWVTVAIAAVVGLGVALYKFRDSTFSLKGTTYELRDIWSAAWISMGKALSWVGGEFGRVVNWMKQVWAGFTSWFSSLSITNTFKKWFTEAMDWAKGILGKLTPQWAIDALNQAKANREKESEQKPASTPTEKPKPRPSPDTAGLGQPKKDIYGDEIRKLNEQSVAQAKYLSVLDATPEKIQSATAAEKAQAVIVELNNKLHDGGRAKLTAKQEAEIRLRESLVETLTALNEYGKELVSQQHSTQLATAQTLTLAKAVLQGDEAVRRVTISNAILALTYGKTAEQIRLMTPELNKLQAEMERKSDAEIVKAANEQVFSTRQQLAAQRQLIPALLEGEQAYREASLSAKLYALDVRLASMAAGEAKDALLRERDAIIEATRAEWAQADAHEALRLKSPVWVYNEETQALLRQIDVLTDNGKQNLSYSEQLAVSAKAQENLNKAIEDTIMLLLKQGSAKDGVTAFFLKMQESARSTASVVYEALTSAFDKVSDNLSKLLTGQKASWAKMFKEIGAQMLRSQIQTGLQKGIGALGKRLGINLDGALGGKPDGSQSKPFYVIVASGAPGNVKGRDPVLDIYNKLHPIPKPPAPAGTTDTDSDGQPAKPNDPLKGLDGLGGKLSGVFDGLLGKLTGSLGGIFGKLSGILGSVLGKLGGMLGGGGGVLSFLGSLIPHADGGPTSPSQAYLVGERGPELFAASQAGYVSDAATTRRVLNNSAGASGDSYFYQIDAKGTDPTLTEQRTKKAIVAAHNSAVNRSFQIQQEQLRRVPQGK